MPLTSADRLTRIDQAGDLLAAPIEPVANPWAGLGAAAFAATAAVLMAGVMVLGPGVALENGAPSSRAGTLD